MFLLNSIFLNSISRFVYLSISASSQCLKNEALQKLENKERKLKQKEQKIKEKLKNSHFQKNMQNDQHQQQQQQQQQCNHICINYNNTAFCLCSPGYSIEDDEDDDDDDGATGADSDLRKTCTRKMLPVFFD